MSRCRNDNSEMECKKRTKEQTPYKIERKISDCTTQTKNKIKQNFNFQPSNQSTKSSDYPKQRAIDKNDQYSSEKILPKKEIQSESQSTRYSSNNFRKDTPTRIDDYPTKLQKEEINKIIEGECTKIDKAIKENNIEEENINNFYKSQHLAVGRTYDHLVNLLKEKKKELTLELERLNNEHKLYYQIEKEKLTELKTQTLGLKTNIDIQQALKDAKAIYSQNRKHITRKKANIPLAYFNKTVQHKKEILGQLGFVANLDEANQRMKGNKVNEVSLSENTVSIILDDIYNCENIFKENLLGEVNDEVKKTFMNTSPIKKHSNRNENNIKGNRYIKSDSHFVSKDSHKDRDRNLNVNLNQHFNDNKVILKEIKQK